MGDLIQSLGVPVVINELAGNFDEQEATAQGDILIQERTLRLQEKSYSPLFPPQSCCVSYESPFMSKAFGFWFETQRNRCSGISEMFSAAGGR